MTGDSILAARPRPTSALRAAVLTAAAAVLGLSAATASPAAAATASVTGTVVASAGRTPVVGADVCVAARGFFECATSGDEGRFTVTGVPSDQPVSIDASADTFYAQTYGYPLGGTNTGLGHPTPPSAWHTPVTVLMARSDHPIVGLTSVDRPVYRPTNDPSIVGPSRFLRMSLNLGWDHFVDLPPGAPTDVLVTTLHDRAGVVLDSSSDEVSGGTSGSGMYAAGNMITCADLGYHGKHRIDGRSFTIRMHLKSDPSVAVSRTVTSNYAACRQTKLAVSRSGKTVSFYVLDRLPKPSDARGVGRVYVNKRVVATKTLRCGNVNCDGSSLYVNLARHLKHGKNSVRLHFTPSTKNITAPPDVVFSQTG